MKKNINITDEKIAEYLDEIYNYFETGYEFENFLKPYLEKMGLDEVKVTQKSRDGGIDLTAIRLGVGDFSDADVSEYYVQAKRYLPSSTISVKDIRQLKGTIPFGHKGMFITTAKFSQDAISESCNDPSKPVVLIDGKKLIESCIDYEIDFVFSPVFSSKMLDKMMGYDSKKSKESIEDSFEKDIISSIQNKECIVEKMITMNDIRAKIVSIPTDIAKLLPLDAKKIKVKLGNTDIKEYHYNSSRKFISGVTEFLQKNMLLDELGGINPKKAKWYFENDIVEVEVEMNEGF